MTLAISKLEGYQGQRRGLGVSTDSTEFIPRIGAHCNAPLNDRIYALPFCKYLLAFIPENQSNLCHPSSILTVFTYSTNTLNNFTSS